LARQENLQNITFFNSFPDKYVVYHQVTVLSVVYGKQQQENKVNDDGQFSSLQQLITPLTINAMAHAKDEWALIPGQIVF
jgi:hypothetical protein